MNPKNNWQIITLSGRTTGELREAVEEFEVIVSCSDGKSLQELSRQTNKNNKHYYYRLAFVANTLENLYDLLQQQLHLFNSNQYAYQPDKVPVNKPIAFLFSGGGAQYADMGKSLYETESIFRQAIDSYDLYLKTILPVSLLDILYPKQQCNYSDIDRISYAQPAMFAFELALCKVWKYWGVNPNVVMGHSLGEYAAACIAGVFSEEDGLKLTAERGRLMQELPGDTLMVAVFTDAIKVREVINEYLNKVTIAAENGPMNTVISGTAPHVRAACKAFEQFDIATHQLKIERAGHSREMEPMIDTYRKILQSVKMAAPKVKLVSNLTGQLIEEQIATAEYWCKHTLDMVQFRSGMNTLSKMDAGCFIEIGPQPMLLSLGQKCLEQQTEKALWLPSLQDKDDSLEQILHGLTQMYTTHFMINWPEIL